MAVQYHTHTFDIPVASTAEAEAGLINDKVITPAQLQIKLSKSANLSDLEDAGEARTNLGLEETAPGAAGLTILGSALNSDVRNFLDTAPYVATRTAAKALDTTKDTTLILTESGREGIFIWTAGDYSTQIAADTAEGIYLKADAIAATSGAWVRTDRDVTPEMFGVIGDGATHASNSANMILWMLACDREGRRGVTLGERTYLVGDTVEVEISNTLEIVLSPGTIIKGEAGDGAVIHITNAVGTRPQFSLAGNCATIDNSLRTYNPSVASGTALELIRMGSIHVSGVTFQGALTFGDSGIAAQECGRGVITGCTFYDQSDIGIYLTGGASTGDTDDWGDIKIIGNHFEGCEIAATARRQIGRTIMSNNTIKDCGAGLQTADATSGVTVIGYDRQIIITGNIGENINGAFVDMRIGGPGSLICDNVVIDWGLTTATSAYGCIGGDGVLISGNSAIVRDLVPTTHAGFSLNDYTDADAVVHQGTNCTVSNNLVVGANTGIRDLSGGNNQFGFNRLLSCTTDYSVDETRVIHQNTTGLGVGTSAPQARFHLDGKARISRVGVAAQYAEVESAAGFLDFISYSATTAAKGVRIRATTDSSHTAASSGNTDIVLDALGVERARAKDTGQFRFFPVSATPTRLEDGDMWHDGTADEFRGRKNSVTSTFLTSRATGSATYDPASLADGAGVTTTVTATGAALGDFVDVSFSLDLQGVLLIGWVSSANTVSVRFQNETGGVVDLASGTIKVRAGL